MFLLNWYSGSRIEIKKPEKGVRSTEYQHPINDVETCNVRGNYDLLNHSSRTTLKNKTKNLLSSFWKGSLEEKDDMKTNPE